MESKWFTDIVDRATAKATKKALEEGKAQGMKEGKVQGKSETLIETVCLAVRKNYMTLEQCRECFSLTEEQVRQVEITLAGENRQ